VIRASLTCGCGLLTARFVTCLGDTLEWFSSVLLLLLLLLL